MVKMDTQDLVSKQMAIDALMDEFKRVPTVAIRAKYRIEQLPPAQPKRGKWIIKDDTERFIAQCNCCRYIEDSRRIKNYCPNCGADMREVIRDDKMTDEMRAICKAAKVNDIGEVSDGFHTFNGLYEQRMILFAALVKAYKDKAWKSYKHEDGEYCFGGGWFIVGIDTPAGTYTYHYENKYWDMFDCIELERSKHWDGHTEADAETRLMSLKPEHSDKLIKAINEGSYDVNLSAVMALGAVMLDTSKQQTGKWIEYEQEFMTDRPFETIKKHIRECSLCRTKIAGFDGIMRYCPNCGAKMEVTE